MRHIHVAKQCALCGDPGNYPNVTVSEMMVARVCPECLDSCEN